LGAAGSEDVVVATLDFKGDGGGFMLLVVDGEAGAGEGGSSEGLTWGEPGVLEAASILTTPLDVVVVAAGGRIVPGDGSCFPASGGCALDCGLSGSSPEVGVCGGWNDCGGLVGGIDDGAVTVATLVVHDDDVKL
jgi:hypothetical protein